MLFSGIIQFGKTFVRYVSILWVETSQEFSFISIINNLAEELTSKFPLTRLDARQNERSQNFFISAFYDRAELITMERSHAWCELEEEALKSEPFICFEILLCSG